VLVSLTAADFLRYTTWSIFILIGFWVVLQAIRRPIPVNVDAAMLFGGLALVIGLTALARAGLIPTGRILTSLTSTVLFSMPFLLVRLMDDVVGVPRTMMRVFMGSWAFYVALAWLAQGEALGPFTLLLVLGLLLTLGYSVVLGLRAIGRTHGVTRRRLIAVSLGSLFLALNFSAGMLPVSPEDARSLVDIFGVAAGIAYYLGFAPPRWLRRVWQGPELRAFLSRSAGLPQLEDGAAMLQALERGAAEALGAPFAGIALWDASSQVLRFPTGDPTFALPESSDLPVARAFRARQPLFSADTQYEAELDAQFQLRAKARAVLAAPIAAGDQPLGVLFVHGPRVSLFAGDDLELLQLMADQAAVVLESRRLGERTARVRAREEAARLKEDFLSAAAHDLKTPLTTLVVQTQLLERRAVRNPATPVDLGGLRRLVGESERLRAIVLELLDASRAEQDRLVGRREPLDLTPLLREAARRHEGERHRFVVEAPERLVGLFDAQRIAQLVENLVENAVKYSPEGGTITVRLWEDSRGANLTVADEGIGIPAEDLPSLFERFHRGSNVDDRRFPGWGLGLSICRRIVQQHDGQIAVVSREGQGSMFHVTLPLAEVPKETFVAARAAG
jgi:signal transduction histidine kinase